MAVKIRLARHGAKKRPFYHIVIADARMPRDGRYIERVGSYNPMVPKDHAERLVVKTERVQHWLSTGAQPTERVARFLGNLGVMPKYVYAESPKRSAPKAKAQELIKQKVDKEEAAKVAAQEAKEAAKVAAAAPAPEPVVEEVAPVADVVEEAVPAVEAAVAEEAPAVEAIVEEEAPAAEALSE